MRRTSILAFVLSVSPLLADPLEAQDVSVLTEASAPDNDGRSVLNRPARLDVQDVALSDALIELSKRSGVAIAFSPSRFEQENAVSCSCMKRTVEQALQRLLGFSRYRYLEVGGHVVVISDQSKELQRHIEPVLSARPVYALASYPTSRRSRAAEAQGTITGQVTDATSLEPLAGVQVMLEDTEFATLSGSAGNFTLADVPAGTHTVVATRLGYESFRQEDVVLAAEETVRLDVQMQTSAVALDELVVVGYGEQTAANVTGSVARTNAGDVARVATPTIGQALQGHTPGVYIQNLNAQPGETKTTFSIRGFGEPLFIVDGHPVEPWQFQEIEPDDIEDLVVLKDAAAAAVYGARAGNGVVLVETKRGTLSAPQFRYQGEFAQQYFLETPLKDMPDAHEYMQFYNMWRESTGQSVQFSEETIENHRRFRDGSNPDFPNVDIFERGLVLKRFSPMHQHNLSIQGGSEDVRYYVSGGLMDQKGMLVSDDIDFDRYNLRSNIDIQLSDNLDLALDLALTNRTYFGGFSQLEGETTSSGACPDCSTFISTRMTNWRPFWPIEPNPLPGGLLLGSPDGRRPNPMNKMRADVAGHRDYVDQSSIGGVSLGYDLPYNFHVGGRYTFQRENFEIEVWRREWCEWAANDEGGFDRVRCPNPFSQYRERRTRTDVQNLNLRLENDTNLGRHNVSGLLLYEQNFRTFGRVDAWRSNYEVPIGQMWVGPDNEQNNWGVKREGGRAGIVGRFGYGYDQRYSAEVSFRYDGSSAFPERSRWGFFPSVGVAWNVSEEPFIRNNPTFGFVDALRLRGSYGRLGYDRAGDWQHLATYSFVDRSVSTFDTSIDRYLAEPRGVSTVGMMPDGLPNPDITWETLDLANVGINFELWGGLLAGEVDVFSRTRDDVLARRAAIVPEMVGAELPEENFEKYRTRGWDLGLSHSHTIGDVGYRIHFTMSRYETHLLHTETGDFLNKEDQRLNDPHGRVGRTWRLETDGFFHSQEEINNWADIDGRNNATIMVGDARYVDRNGDRRITLADAIVIGQYADPMWTYGFQASINWRGFELYTAWQGSAGFGQPFDQGSGSNLIVPFAADSPPHEILVDNSYVPEGNRWRESNTDASWPCLCNADGPSWDGVPGLGLRGQADYMWGSADYIKLRHLQLSYQIPERLLSAFGVDNARINLSGYNLFTYAPGLGFTDPEYDLRSAQPGRLSVLDDGQTFGEAGNNTHWPTGSYNIGIELDF